MKWNGILAAIIALMMTQPMLADECETCCDSNEFLDCLCDPCSGWTFNVDWLWWKIRRSGLDYAVLGMESNSITIAGKMHCVEPDRDSGFRISLFKECDCWDFGLRFTHYNSDESEKLQNLAENIYITRSHSGGDFEDSGLVDYAHSKYELELGMLDFEVGYRMDFECVNGNVRPFSGVKLFSIDQSMKTIYRDTLSSPIQDELIEEKLNLDAYGLYCGLEGQWKDIWCNVGMFGRTSLSLSLANIESRFSQYDFDNLEVVELEYEAKNEKWCVTPYWEVALGLQYDLCDFQCVDWSIQLGYEFHHWCNLNDFINFVSISSDVARDKMNLGMDGLFLRLHGTY